MKTWVLFAAIVIATPLPSSGQAPPSALRSSDEHEWSRGISESERAAADALYADANALLRESICDSAAKKYKEALVHWDHPAIHFGLALALLTLDRPEEMHEHLTQALRYGSTPYSANHFELATNYRKLLENQLAHVRVRCAVSGARVSLDGRTLFEAPGSYDGWIRAGHHFVVAAKDGFETNQVERDLQGGSATALKLDLETRDALVVETRRWPRWMPWTLTLAGAAVAGGGGLLWYYGDKRIQDFDRDGKANPTKHTISSKAVRDTQTRRMQQGAYAAWTVGGAALVTGLVLLPLNRAHVFMRSYDADDKAAVVPTIGYNGTMLSLSASGKF